MKVGLGPCVWPGREFQLQSTAVWHCKVDYTQYCYWFDLIKWKFYWYYL